MKLVTVASRQAGGYSFTTASPHATAVWRAATVLKSASEHAPAPGRAQPVCAGAWQVGGSGRRLLADPEDGALGHLEAAPDVHVYDDPDDLEDLLPREVLGECVVPAAETSSWSPTRTSRTTNEATSPSANSSTRRTSLPGSEDAAEYERGRLVAVGRGEMHVEMGARLAPGAGGHVEDQAYSVRCLAGARRRWRRARPAVSGGSVELGLSGGHSTVAPFLPRITVDVVSVPLPESRVVRRHHRQPRIHLALFQKHRHGTRSRAGHYHQVRWSYPN
jgi:hypothetical protein